MLDRFAGALVGLIVGIILLQFGFWEAVFLLVCMGIGWRAGAALFGGINLAQLLARYLRGSRRWR